MVCRALSAVATKVDGPGCGSVLASAGRGVPLPGFRRYTEPRRPGSQVDRIRKRCSVKTR
jgi:hypothetical protein